MHISNHFVISCYNIIGYIMFNFVIIVVVLIFTNRPFPFIASQFTTPLPRLIPTLTPAYLILPNVPTPLPLPHLLELRTPRLLGTQE